MVVHSSVSVKLLQRQIYSLLVLFGQLILRLDRAQERSGTNQQEQPRSHLSLSVCAEQLVLNE